MNENLPIQVAIVEDEDEIRQTLALIIDGTNGFSCKHTFSDCESALKILPEAFVNVVLMDINLPGMSGIEGVKQLKPVLPEVDFMMLTINKEDEVIFDAISAGASGYLVKDTPPADLLRAITEVTQGGAPMSTYIARRVVQSFHRTAASPLTERETEILRLLCDGLNYKTIAGQLFISANTVRVHIKNIYEKLHVSSRAQAVSTAINKKLI